MAELGLKPRPLTHKTVLCALGWVVVSDFFVEAVISSECHEFKARAACQPGNSPDISERIKIHSTSHLPPLWDIQCSFPSASGALAEMMGRNAL